MVKGGSRKRRRVEEGGNGKECAEYKKGLWTTEEDNLLLDYVNLHGKGKWNRIHQLTGLKRCGKSCRLRWMNYLSPHIKRGEFSQEEDDLIIRLHKLLGNRWSLIAGRVPGRTDNQVKNYWNTHLSKKLGIEKGKDKLIQTGSPTLHSIDNMGTSNITPLEDNLQSVGGSFDKLMCIEDIANGSLGEASSGKDILSTENQNFQDSVMLSAEDNNLIVDTQSLLDFLREYSLDYTWNNIL